MLLFLLALALYEHLKYHGPSWYLALREWVWDHPTPPVSFFTGRCQLRKRPWIQQLLVDDSTRLWKLSWETNCPLNAPLQGGGDDGDEKGGKIAHQIIDQHHHLYWTVSLNFSLLQDHA